MKKILLLFLIVFSFVGCKFDDTKYTYKLDVVYNNGDRDTFDIVGFKDDLLSIDRSTFNSRTDLVRGLNNEVIATNVRRFNLLSKTKIN